MLFWIIAAILVFVSGLILVLPMLRARAEARDAVASDLDVYKDQLKELDSDISRGVLSASEAETSRAEIARRLLAASERQAEEPRPAPRDLSRGLALALLLAVAGGSVLTYAQIGKPGLPDQPLASRETEAPRPTQAEIEARVAETMGDQRPTVPEREAELLDQLREALKTRPDELTGHKLLATTLNSLGQYDQAWRAQEDVLRILGNDAKASDYADKAEMMIFAAAGYVSPEADDALARALQTNAGDARARYYSGISMAQNGRPGIAMQLWTGLLEEGPDDAPWKEPVREQIRTLSANTGIPLPEVMLRGPTQEDVEAAGQMSAEDRQDMIRGMVEGLSDRLATEGGDPSEWARLIRALTVLNETDRARAIYEEALETFAGNDAAITALNEAAAGL